MASKDVNTELQKCFDAIEAQDLSVKDIDKKIKEVKKANDKINRMLSEDDIPGDPKNIIVVPVKVLAAGAIASTVTALVGIGLLGISALIAIGTIPMAFIKAICAAFAPGKERLEGIRDINTETIKFLEKLKARKSKIKESVDMNSVISEYDYTHEAVWNGFLMNRISEQIEMNRYISECCAICEGVDVFDKLVAVNEGVTDKIKEGWAKAKSFFKRIWAKFVERLTSFFTSNQTYLDKYKEIILKKPMKALDDVTMPNHTIGIQRIIGCAAPIMTPQILDGIYKDMQQNKDNLDQVKENFINKYLLSSGGKFSEHNKENVEYAEFAKKYFQGGDEVTMNAASLNLEN